jgi:radical SAM mobile pair protein B
MNQKIKIQEIKVKSVVTKSNLPVSDYSVNPYVGCLHGCKYCYASFMRRFTNHLEPWGTFVDIKYWEEIKNPAKYEGKELFIGSVTDPYQPLEAKFKRTKTLLEELQGYDIKLSIATRSDLILRDLDLIKSFKNARVSWSINTLEDVFQKDMDKAVVIERRIECMRLFHEAGVRTACFISPIFPGITDVKAIIKRCQNYCNFIWLENLNLRGEYKKVILNYIKMKYPELYPLYDEIYLQKRSDYWIKLNEEIASFCEQEGLLYVENDDSISRSFIDKPIVVNYFYHEKIKKSARVNNG